MALKTRKPTGRAPWPFVLLEGVEKGGKTFSALQLSASDKVGPTYAIDLGEGSLDEYAPLGPFEIIEHDGTFRDLLEQLGEVLALPVDPERPTVLVIDSLTHLWEALKSEADETARARLRKKGREPGPDVEVQITMDLWNTAAGKWRKVVGQLLTWPGIVVATARGGEVAAVENGRPVEGKKDWAVQAHKSLPYDASVIVRFTGPRSATLVGARSLALQLPEGKTLPLPNFTLEDLIFTKLGLSGDNTAPRRVTQANTADAVTDTAWLQKWQPRVAMAPTEADLKALYEEMTSMHGEGRLADSDRADAVELVNKALAILRAPAPSNEPAAAPEVPAAPQAAAAPSTAEVAEQTMTRLRQAVLKQLQEAGVDIEAECAETFGMPADQVETKLLRSLMPEPVSS